MRPARHFAAVALALLLTLQGCLLFPSYIGKLSDYTPVVAAAAGGDIATVRTALDRYPKLIKYREWEGATLLHGAVGRNQLEMAEFLLSRGAAVNAKDKEAIRPLHVAAMNGNVPILRLLLDHGAKRDPIDRSGRTPLDRAVEWEQADAAEFLRGRGAEPGNRRPPGAAIRPGQP